jgi:hypothetical protein
MKRKVLWVLVVTGLLMLNCIPSFGSVVGNFAQTSCEKLESNFLLDIDLGGLDGKSEDDIGDEIKSVLEAHLSNLPLELNCKVSVKGTINIGVASVDINVEVSGPCDKIRAQGTALARQVLSEISQALRR